MPESSCSASKSNGRDGGRVAGNRIIHLTAPAGYVDAAAPGVRSGEASGDGAG